MVKRLFSAPASGLVRFVASNQNELYFRRRRDGWGDAAAGLAAPFGRRPKPSTAAWLKPVMADARRQRRREGEGVTVPVD
jgi:hypothetical protein